MKAWLADHVAELIAFLVVALLLAAALFWGVHSITAGKTAKAETRLNANMASAAVDSGRDAVATVGKQGAAEAAEDALTRENDNAIRHAKGADAPVDPAARDAALRGLCQRAAYRGDPKCLLHFTPAGMAAGGSGGAAVGR